MTAANTPKHVAIQLRSALQAADGPRSTGYQLGALTASVEYAVKQLDQQLDTREIANEIDTLRQSLIDHASCVRRRAGSAGHRISQLLGAIEASAMRLEMLRDRLTESTRPVYAWAESNTPAGSAGAA